MTMRISGVLLCTFLATTTPALAQDNQPGQHFIEGWDADGDGKVTLAELEPRRADVFYMFDEVNEEHHELVIKLAKRAKLHYPEVTVMISTLL